MADFKLKPNEKLDVREILKDLDTNREEGDGPGESMSTI